jgi:hypothetical protein
MASTKEGADSFPRVLDSARTRTSVFIEPRELLAVDAVQHKAGETSLKQAEQPTVHSKSCLDRDFRAQAVVRRLYRERRRSSALAIHFLEDTTGLWFSDQMNEFTLAPQDTHAHASARSCTYTTLLNVKSGEVFGRYDTRVVYAIIGDNAIDRRCRSSNETGGTSESFAHEGSPK